MNDKKIFIVEDDADLLYGLESEFSADNFEIATSYGDEEVSELLNNIRSFKPDFIVIDLILPKADGFDIIKKIKADEFINQEQIFVFTDLSEEDGRVRSLDIGTDYIFFRDDFDTYEFAEKVKKIIVNREKIVADAPEDVNDVDEGEDPGIVFA
ncbi:MAG: response regulator [Patescibacteria group bacterium]|jgi:two-component system alkaline phosphatase synthesis response regulator PhoP|nr:response regulator [Patescibacteria group bacterium]